MNQGQNVSATCSDITGLQKPISEENGLPRLTCRGVEPMATVLTAGSTK